MNWAKGFMPFKLLAHERTVEQIDKELGSEQYSPVMLRITNGRGDIRIPSPRIKRKKKSKSESVHTKRKIVL